MINERIKEVEYIGNYTLKFTFEDGLIVQHDFESYLKKYEIFKRFLKLENFINFKLDNGMRLYWKGNILDFHYSLLRNNI